VEAWQHVQPSGPNRSILSSSTLSPKRAFGFRLSAFGLLEPARSGPRSRGQTTEDRRQCPPWARSPPRFSDLCIAPCPSSFTTPAAAAEAEGRGEPRPSVLCRLSSDRCARGTAARGLVARPGDHSVREPPDPIPNSAVKPHRAQGTALLRVGERVVARSGDQSRCAAPDRPTPQRPAKSPAARPPATAPERPHRPRPRSLHRRSRPASRPAISHPRGPRSGIRSPRGGAAR
jgi:hypothetical protein